MRDAGGGGGSFSGIDPKALQGTITSLKADTDRLRGSASRFKSRFEHLGMDTQPLTQLLHIAAWADDQLPMLRRRHLLAVAMDKGDYSFARYPNRPDMIQVDDAQVAADPAKPEDVLDYGDPKLNAEWWGALTPGMKAELQFLYPDRIGTVDGLPASVRDRANRVVLDDLYRATREKLAKLKAQEPARYKQAINYATGTPIPGGQIETSEWQHWNEQLALIDGQLKGMDAIYARFDRTGVDGLPQAYLLGIDTQHLGHAIVANGNPDTSDHTAVLVPGTTSKLAGADGDLKRMENLWQATRPLALEQSVSTITWIGYDAPQSIVPQAMSIHYADNGAPVLNRFLDGLQAAHGGPNACHTTVIGHSYGSTLVGDASKQPGHFAADDIVVAGSPGMRVGNAGQLDVGAKHTWSEAAGLQYDQVPAGGKIAALGGSSVDVRKWHGIPYEVDVNIDVVPSDRAFGANIMQTDSHSHSGYWEPNSVSLWNQAAVATGRYDKVRRE